MSTVLEVVYQPLGQINVEDSSTAITIELALAAIGPKGDVGDVNPEMYTILADAEDARDAAASSATDAANDALATAADRVQTGLDKTATAADRLQTGLDKTATAADRVQTGLDADATAADVIATAADRVQTGLDRTEAAASETAAEAAAETATTKAAEADASADTATTKAAESANSATQSAASAASAATQAGIATTKANEASASAASALESKNAAAASQTASAASQSAAAVSATAASNSATASAASATAAQGSASSAEAAQVNAQNYLGQTQYARDQALAGLGAADNSQVLSELLGTITYALDLAGQAAKEMPSLAALFPAIDSIGTHIVAMMDLLGVTARSISGGDVLLGTGLVGAPSLAAKDDRNTGIYFPAADQLAIVTGGVQRLLIDATGNHATGTDNAQTLGTASKRWSTVYAGTGTINTSDAREKTAVTPLSAAELAAASAMAKEIGSYQFLASIADKGDAARHHVGLTVQRAIEIMEGNGLNPFKYGFICHDAWPEIVVEHPAVEAVDDELDEDGNVIRPGTPAKDAYTEIVQAAGDRYAFRYDQLALFIAAGFEARLSALETA